ncbi:TetR/AcrR family transcriptional regulator [Candidatus Protofrankia californiensis]|uniref:TetR/AcrR family transcriptional regulator n=1 Tax=Candidatus Protofrankia californiensis TaxID=1839754 RepID=UPI0010415ADD|nr:TetR/AcrR family transcriptional regulator [Candidatus Protofrankia californiensis]
MDGAVQAPRRGTRPRNRRHQIVAAAAELFARDGYPHMSMSDIADAVAVQPSALYRHFRGKEQLLYEVVHHALSAIRSSLDEAPPDGGGAVSALVRAVLEHRRTGVLWQRESRHLQPHLRTRLRHELVGIQHEVAGVVAQRRPAVGELHEDLLAWAVMGALMSVSFQRIELPRAEYEDLLVAIADDVLRAPLRRTGDAPLPATVAPPATRRDELLTAAARLFAERGYQTVGIDDVGAAAGIAGPSVYNHFDSKLDLLGTVILDGAEQLQHDGSEVLDSAANNQDALRGLARSYADFSFAHSDAMDLLITETAHLPERERTAIRDTQRSYIAEWVRLLRRVHPDLPAAHARVRVQAILSLTNDIARTPHLRAQADALTAVCDIGKSILGLEHTARQTARR